MNNNPRISVVMTVFNGERFIKEALNSILNQTFTDFEFIIIDNASTDGTKRITSSYTDPRIIFIENKENLGQTKAINIGIKRSRGEFIARMDADDISLPQRLQLQYEYLIKNNSVGAVGTWHEEIDENGKHLKNFRMPTNPLEIKCYLISPGELGYYCLSHPTVMIRKNALLQMGFYNNSYLPQDYDLWVRISRNYKIANLNKFLVKHRIFKNQQTKEFKQRIESDCEKIIISNIRYYRPKIQENELMPLVRMLQYKPQISKVDGLKALETFKFFFKEIMGTDMNNRVVKNAYVKMEAFYLLQLIKTNTLYSLKRLLKLLCVKPDILLDYKFYRKIARVQGKGRGNY